VRIETREYAVYAGNLSKDVKFSTVGENQTPKATFSMQVNTKRNRDGSQPEAKWVNVVAWRNWALVSQNLLKGDSVMVCGHYEEPREYNGKTYVDFTAEFISVQATVSDGYTPLPVKPADSTVPPPMQEIDEDLPF